MIKYHYAKTSSGEVIPISEAVTGTPYYCVGCGQEMLARKGNVREHHFSHRHVIDCDGETYIHQIAKLYIKKLFDTQEHLDITFQQTTECCQKETCTFWKANPDEYGCSTKETVTKNLKKWYDTCEVEADYKGFVADILLRNRKRPEVKPCFIEIAVTHFCKPDKIKSGIPIIEVFIPKISDDFESLKTLVETEKDFSGRKSRKSIQISFYNKKQILSETPMDLYDIPVFFLNRNGKGQVEVVPKCCSSYGKQHLEGDFTYEIHFSDSYLVDDKPAAYRAGVAIANLEHGPLANCLVCKHYWYSYMRGSHNCNKFLYAGLLSEASSCREYVFNPGKAWKLRKSSMSDFKIILPKQTASTL